MLQSCKKREESLCVFVSWMSTMSIGHAMHIMDAYNYNLTKMNENRVTTATERTTNI